MDAVYVFDRTGRPVIDYKIRESNSRKVFAAIEGNSQGLAELSSSQLVYWHEISRAYVAIVFGSAQSPLAVQDFASNFLVVLNQYFNHAVSLAVIDANAATVLCLIDLMLDNGVPCLSEPSIICALVPTTAATPGPELEFESHRRAGVKYTTQEIYIDVEEKITLECSSTQKLRYSHPKPLQCFVKGEITVLSKLSNDPHVSIDFIIDPKARLSLHPAVDSQMWARQNVLSFIPADGKFTVANYKLEIPNFELVSCSLSTGLGIDQNEFEVHVVVAMDTLVKFIDNLQITLVAPEGKAIKENRLTAGEVSNDPKDSTKFLWTFNDAIPVGWEASLRGSFVGRTKFPSFVQVDYSLMGRVPSKAVVKSVNLPAMQKKPYKGVRYRTLVDNMLVRP